MNQRFNIIAPLGGFGNHVRWLILLDSSFTFNLQDNIVLNNITQKIDFIKDFVYSADRTWHNWLQFEWRYREDLDTHIQFGHSLVEIGHPDKQTLILKTNPDLAYKSYLKFNSNLNNRPRSRFTDDVNQINNLNVEGDNFLLLNSDMVYQPTLNRDLYTTLINFFELDDLYNEANFIHTLWYKGQQRSEYEFVKDITELYGPTVAFKQNTIRFG